MEINFIQLAQTALIKKIKKWRTSKKKSEILEPVDGLTSLGSQVANLVRTAGGVRIPRMASDF